MLYLFQQFYKHGKQKTAFTWLHPACQAFLLYQLRDNPPVWVSWCDAVSCIPAAVIVTSTIWLPPPPTLSDRAWALAKLLFGHYFQRCWLPKFTLLYLPNYSPLLATFPAPLNHIDGYFINPVGNLGHPVAYTLLHISPTYIHKSHIHREHITDTEMGQTLWYRMMWLCPVGKVFLCCWSGYYKKKIKKDKIYIYKYIYIYKLGLSKLAR